MEQNKKTEQTGSDKAKKISDGIDGDKFADSIVTLVDKSIKLAAKLGEMPPEELTDIEHEFISATAAAGLSMMMISFQLMAKKEDK